MPSLYSALSLIMYERKQLLRPWESCPGLSGRLWHSLVEYKQFHRVLTSDKTTVYLWIKKKTRPLCNQGWEEDKHELRLNHKNNQVSTILANVACFLPITALAFLSSFCYLYVRFIKPITLDYWLHWTKPCFLNHNPLTQARIQKSFLTLCYRDAPQFSTVCVLLFRKK